MPEPVEPAAADRFVGRAHELTVLRSAFRAAVAGEARLVLVAGEPGIGKTELVRAFAREVRGDGALVLWGSAWEESGAPPYWPWVQILQGYRRQAGAQALAGAAGHRSAVLGQLLPELGPAGEQGAPGQWARFALFEAVGAVLDRASGAAPLVVILDDLHAAGRGSALLLRFVAAAGLSRVLLLATYRAAESRLDPEVSDVITGLESAATPITLAGLSPEEVMAMLPGADAETAAAVQRRSEGNPLFVWQVARTLGRGAASVDEVPVPTGIRQATRRQVARLGETWAGHADGTLTAGEVLATAAALGPWADPDLVAAVLDVPIEPVAGLFDDATEAGLLRAGAGAGTGTGEAYRFRHALIRETLYTELAPRARAQTHGRIGAVLEGRARPGRAGHAELAYHFVRAAATGGQAAAKAVTYSRLAGQDALNALAYEEAAGHFRQALEVHSRAEATTPTGRCELLLDLAEALTRTGPHPDATRVLDEAVRLARQVGQPRLLATAALLNAQHLDFNAPAEAATALLREAAGALEEEDRVLTARALARLAIALAPEPAAARAAADQAVQVAREAVDRAAPRGPGDRTAAGALAAALTARQHVRWGTQDPRQALADADEIIAVAQRADDRDTELDGRVLRLTRLLELGDGPACQRVLPELDRLAEVLRHPTARLVAWSRRSMMAALTGDFPRAAELSRQAWQSGVAAGIPDAGSVYWGQLFAIWLHAGLPGGDERWMERELRDLVARSHLSVAHAAALILIDAAHGADGQANGRLDELVGTGLDRLQPDMVYVWALSSLAQGCRVLRAARHAPRLYQALAPYAGRAVVAAGAVLCAGSTDYYLAGLAELSGDTTAADRHFRAAISCHRRLEARPMLAHTLHDYCLLLRQRGDPGDLSAASIALAEAQAIATECGMTRLLAVLDQPQQPAPGHLRLIREGEVWLINYADELMRVPDSLGLRYLDLLIRNPGRELPAQRLVQLAAATGAASAGIGDGFWHDTTEAPADDILDAQARAAYRHRLADLDAELAEAEQWSDTERASRLRAEKDFLVHELTAAAGLGGRPRQLGSESERARVNVTRAIRSAISRIRHHAPGAAAHLDQAIRTGSRCSYVPAMAPDRVRHP